MVEFQKQEAKEGFQTGRYTFNGRATKPKSGEGAKGPWCKEKIRMQRVDSEYEHKFVMWSPLTSKKSKYKEVSELVEFDKEYDIVWVEENKEFVGKEWVEKKIIIINDAEGELKENKSSTTTSSIPEPSKPKIDIELVKKLCTKYFEKVKEKKKTPDLSSFIGIYNRKYGDKELIAALSATYETVKEEFIEAVEEEVKAEE